MPATSAASATGPRWRRPPGSCPMHFVNASGSVLVAPFGGTERRLSTAPFCVGVPRPGADADGARFRHLGRGRGQGAGGEPGRQEAARQRADQPRRQDERRSARALRRLHADQPAHDRHGHGRHPRLRRSQGLGPRPHVRAAGRLADRHERHRRGRGRSCGNGMLSFYVDPAVVDPEGSSRPTSPATSPTSRAPSRRRPAARC